MRGSPPTRRWTPLRLSACLAAGMLFAACGTASPLTAPKGTLRFQLLDADAGAHDAPLAGTVTLSREGATITVAASSVAPRKVPAGRWKLGVIQSPFLLSDPGQDSPNCGPVPGTVVIIAHRDTSLVIYCGDAT